MSRPWVRFLVLGIALFVAHQAWTRTPTARAALGPVAGTALDDRELLFRVALARGLHEEDTIVRRRLAQNMRFALDLPQAPEAELVDQALALGMHESDLVVRRRLVQKMLLLLEAHADALEPSDEELRAWRRAHPQRWLQPARRDLTQLFFATQAAAREVTDRLGSAGEAPAALGEALPLPRRLPQQAARDLERLLGADFARAVFDAPLGRWSQPIRSAYGWHRVYVHAHGGGGPSPLESVRSEVRGHWRAARRAQARSEGIAALRERWSVPAP
jgi:hypothetical protein